MKTRYVIFCLVWFAAVSTKSADPDPLAPLDEALKFVATFEYGKDAAPLDLVEQIVIASARKPELRSNVEERLVQTLNSSATSKPVAPGTSSRYPSRSTLVIMDPLSGQRSH